MDGGVAISDEDLVVLGVAQETLRQTTRALLVAGRAEQRRPATVAARPKVLLPLANGSYTAAAHAKSTTTNPSRSGAPKTAWTATARNCCSPHRECSEQSRASLHHTPIGYHRFASPADIPVCTCPGNVSFQSDLRRCTPTLTGRQGPSGAEGEAIETPG